MARLRLSRVVEPTLPQNPTWIGNGLYIKMLPPWVLQVDIKTSWLSALLFCGHGKSWSVRARARMDDLNLSWQHG